VSKKEVYIYLDKTKGVMARETIIRSSREIPSSIPEFICELEGLLEQGFCEITVDSDVNYGSCTTEVTFRVDRKATEEEIDEYNNAQEILEIRQRENKLAQLEKLKKELGIEP
jgi:hypothetical protein